MAALHFDHPNKEYSQNRGVADSRNCNTKFVNHSMFAIMELVNLLFVSIYSHKKFVFKNDLFRWYADKGSSL